MSGNFIDAYQNVKQKVPGIPHFEMNGPVTPANKLADVGIEVEVEPARGHSLPTEGHLEKVFGEKSKARWTVHPDNSLRNGGLEYVLTTPCYVDEVDTMLGGLYDTFKVLGSKLALSNRCSTHVHVNQGGRKINELTSTIAVWSTFEEALINWCGEERTNNHFCLSGKDTLALVQAWDRYLSKGALDLGEGMKYSSLNLRNLKTIGSFEYRTMRADNNPLYMIDWVKLCHGFNTYATANYKNPESLAGDLSERGGTAIFTDLCRASNVRDVFVTEVLSNPGNQFFDQMAMDGFRRVQPLVLGYPWHNWMDMIGEPYAPNPFGVKVSSKFDPDEAEGVEWHMPEDRPRPDRSRFGGQAVAPAGRGRPRMPEIPERVVLGGPLNVLRAVVNPDLPIVFGDGTPVEARNVGASMIHARARRPLGRATSWAAGNMSAWASYNLVNGVWNGADWADRHRPWIRNATEEEIQLMNFVEGQEELEPDVNEPAFNPVAEQPLPPVDLVAGRFEVRVLPVLPDGAARRAEGAVRNAQALNRLLQQAEEDRQRARRAIEDDF